MAESWLEALQIKTELILIGPPRAPMSAAVAGGPVQAVNNAA